MDEADVPTEALRAALELGFAVAVAGSKASPKLPAPAELRPFLKFAKLPDRALEPVRRALRDDADFRALVLPAASEELVGRAGWLWLHRPDGWADQLAAELDRRREEAAAVARLDARLRRQLDAAQAAARRSAVERRVSEEAAAAARVEASRARKELAAAIARAERAEARIAQLDIELAAARRKVDEGASERRRLQAELDHSRDDQREARVLAALEEGRAAVSRAGEAVDVAVAQLRADPAPVLSGAARGAKEVPRRARAVVPAGLTDADRAGVEGLLRTPGAAVVLDGYNVGFALWPDQAVAELRRRVTRLAGELGLRLGIRPTVVFDGAGSATSTPARDARVEVRFSEAGATADDAIVALAGSLDLSVPVVVVTNDRELQVRLAATGATCLGVDRFDLAARRS